jgi:hypothetical protein
MRHSPSNRRGFALLVSVMLLALVGAVLCSVVRRTAASLSASTLCEQQLRVRWALRSCQETILRQSEDILAAEESRSGRPVLRAVRSVELDGDSYVIVVADEQAKVNVNRLAQELGSAAVRERVGRLVEGIPEAPRVIAQPARGGRPQSSLFETYEQVFEQPGVESLSAEDPDFNIARDVTCWGSGALQFRRASRASLEALCTPLLTGPELERFVRSRDQGSSLPRAIDATLASQEKRKRLERLLTARSLCHSVWVVRHAGSADLGSACAGFTAQIELGEDQRGRDPQPVRRVFFEW